MPVTASRADGPSQAVPSPSPCSGDSNDPSQSLPSFAFIIYQLSLLISTLGSTPNDAFTRQQLLAAMSNVLCASLQLTHLPSHSSSAVSAAPAPPVASPVTEPARPATPPASSPSSSPSPSASPSPPAFTIRVLTPIEPPSAPPLRSHGPRRSRKRRRARSCPSSPVPSMRTAPAAAVATSSPNSFAPLAQLDNDAAEQASQDDTIASKLSVPIATSSSPAVLPSHNDALPTPVLPTNPNQPPATPVATATAPTVPSSDPTPAEPTAPKRRCTESRSAAAPTPHHRFFEQLHTRPTTLREHFEKHYSPTSPICPCDLFPVYSSKLHCDVKLPPEFDGLCLSCAFYLCMSLGAPVLSALSHWLPSAEAEVKKFHSPLYSATEATAVTTTIPQKARKAYDARIARCAQQLLVRLGGCGR